MKAILDTPEQRLRDTLGLLIPYTEEEIQRLESTVVEQDCEL